MLPPAGDRGEAVASPAAAGGDASAPASTAVNAELVEVFKKVAEAHFKAGALCSFCMCLNVVECVGQPMQW